MDKASVVRSVVLFVALINQGLAAFGYSPLPFEDNEVEQFVSLLITVGASLVAWYKNNYVGKKGIQQEAYLKDKGLK